MSTTDEKIKSFPIVTERQFLAMRDKVKVIRKNLNGMLEDTRIELPSGHMLYNSGPSITLKCISRDGNSIIIKMFRDVSNLPFAFSFTAGGDLDRAIDILEEARDVIVKKYNYIPALDGVHTPRSSKKGKEKKRRKKGKGKEKERNESTEKDATANDMPTSAEKPSSDTKKSTTSSVQDPSPVRKLSVLKYKGWDGKLFVPKYNLVIHRSDASSGFKAIGVEIPDGKVRALNDEDIAIVFAFGFLKDQETFDKEKGEDGFIHIPCQPLLHERGSSSGH